MKAGLATLIGVALVAVATSSVAWSAGEGSRASPPKVVQLSYSEVNDGTSPRYRLQGFARRADSLRFKVRARGKTATAGSRYVTRITDTDLKGDARHPFVVRRKHGGRRVMKLIRRSLHRRGVVKVRVRVRGRGGTDSVRLEIDLADCSRQPPIYPVDCEVKG